MVLSVTYLELLLQALKGTSALDQALSSLLSSGAGLSGGLVGPLTQDDAFQPAHLLLGVAAAQLLVHSHCQRSLVGEPLQSTGRQRVCSHVSNMIPAGYAQSWCECLTASEHCCLLCT